jgi:hypothetical protein
MPPDDDSQAVFDVARMSDLVAPFAIRVAATLRVADHIAAGRTTAPEIASAEQVDAGVLDRVLRHLVTIGLLTGDTDFALTERGAVLRSEHPSEMRDVLDLDGALGRGDAAFASLLHGLRTGDNAFAARYGADFWTDVSADPKRQAGYDRAMASDVRAWAPPIIAAYDWGSFDRIVDVAGGDGTLLVEILRAFPALRGTVFDQPATAAAARATIAAADLSDRADATSGNFFEAVPAGADAYLLCAIVHDWDDEHARIILRRCRDAAEPSGRVFVIEKIGSDGATPNTAMDLRLLVYMNGAERTPTALGELIATADLDVVEVHPAGAITILECRPV